MEGKIYTSRSHLSASVEMGIEGMNTPEEDRPSHLRVYLSVLAASFLYVSTGAVIGWSSPVLPKLNLTTEEQSLVGSLYSLGAAPGPFIVTIGLDTIGRKGTLYVIWAFFMTAWIMLSTSQNIYIIYIGRLICGLGVGGASSGIPVYITEVALPEIRGRLGAMSQMSLALGTLIMYALGPYISYTSLSLCGVAISAIFWVFFYFAPESPYYYCRKGKTKEAEETIQKLRGYKTREKLEEDLAQVEKSIMLEKESSINFLIAIRQPVSRKTLALSLFIVAIQQIQGINPIQVYNQIIFEKAMLSFPATTVPFIYFFMGMTFFILPVLLVNRLFGVKTAYLISCFGTSISLFLLGLYFYLINTGGVDLYDYSYISVVFLVLSSLFSHLGIAPLSWTIIAEILPLSVKGICSGICGCISSLIGFVLLAIFPIVAERYGYSTDFFGYSGLLFVCAAIAIFIIPDTTGKSLREIQDLLAE